jgi:surfeit locus 1 family protein
MLAGMVTANARREDPQATSSRSRALLAAAMAFLALVFVGLGTWQVQRLFWKLDLIERVDQRVHAPPEVAPSAAQWPDIQRDTHEYRRVLSAGTFVHDKTVLVQAVTDRGAGFWVMTPLMQQDGSILLINRGFVPGDRRDRESRIAGEVTGRIEVTGLLRMSEPQGAFLRSNDVVNGRWYSRDVAAIAAANGLLNIAPYFVDADAETNPGGLPVGGLTVISFRNSHLVYALTWFFLAVMSAGAAFAIQRRLIA